MSLKRGFRYSIMWLFVFFVQTPWIVIRAGLTFANIMLFVLAGVLVIGVGRWVGLRDLISAVLLFGLAEETLRIVWIAVSNYTKAKRMKDDIESGDAMQFCYGLVLSQTPRFLASVLAVSIAFWMHIRLGWGFFGTILTVIFIEVLAEKMFEFTVVLLVGVVAEKTSVKKRHKLPKEVKEVLAALDLVESQFDNCIFMFDTVKQRAGQIISNGHNRVIHAVTVQKVTPMNVALVNIMEAAYDYLLSGDYHIRRGVLLDSGEEIWKISHIATELLVADGYMTNEEAEKYRADVSEAISSSG